MKDTCETNMIKLSATNENAIVSHTIGDAVDQDHCRVSKESPPPSLDGLSISTTSSAQIIHGNEKIKQDLERDQEAESEFNDCSSSLSSQDSSNVVFTNTVANGPKRSVFSQYWQKTGQKPVPLRPIRSLSTSAIIQQSPSSQEKQRSSCSASTFDASSTPSRASSWHSLLDEPLLDSVTNAELLEDDGDSSLYGSDEAGEDFSDPPSKSSQQSPGTPPSHHHPLPRRRRSILPPAPTISSLALKSSPKRSNVISWKKSASLTNVEEYSRSTPMNAKHKTRSFPGIRSSSSSSLLQSPGPSCLRRNPKYSPNASGRALVASPMPSSHSVPSMQQSPVRPGALLSRSDSSTSSVSFQEVVDVHHFEIPRETYSGKGWSDYFK